MKGIIVDDLQLIISKNRYDINVVKENIKSIKDMAQNLKIDLKNNDLTFLTSKTDYEIAQFDNFIRKMEAYNETLNGILISYQKQAETLTMNIKQLSS